MSLGAVLGAVWLLQRRFARGAKKDRTREPVRVVAKRGIGAKAQLVVVEIDDVRYVLGVTDGGVSVIDRQPAEGEAPARRSLTSVAPVTALPVATLAPATPASAGPSLAGDAGAAAPVESPLPLRRTHAPRRRPAAPESTAQESTAPGSTTQRSTTQGRAAARAARSTSLSGFLQKDAAQVLRRALGA